VDAVTIRPGLIFH